MRLIELLLTAAHLIVGVWAFYCREVLESSEIIHIDLDGLKKCLQEINGEVLTKNVSENVWRLLKNNYNGLENMPAELFLDLGYTLATIPLEDLRNISLDRVEIVEAFGAIRTTKELQGLSEAHNELLAQKIEQEWSGKTAETYSEYDLRSMGSILCHLNVKIIEGIHAVAFKNAIEWIGRMQNCPHERLEALANLAKQHDAFGQPSTWSMLTVNLMGTILNGLSQADLASIDEEKLRFNRYWAELHKDDKKQFGTTLGKRVKNNDGKGHANNVTNNENSTQEMIEEVEAVEQASNSTKS